jgi:hypothetical protein
MGSSNLQQPTGQIPERARSSPEAAVAAACWPGAGGVMATMAGGSCVGAHTRAPALLTGTSLKASGWRRRKAVTSPKRPS